MIDEDIDEEYRNLLKQYHKLSDRHILAVETDMPYSDVKKIVALTEEGAENISVNNDVILFELNGHKYQWSVAEFHTEDCDPLLRHTAE